MGKIHVDLFMTLDGIIQAPGLPDEDPAGGFPFGGWQARLFDDATGEQVGAGIAQTEALLLGRRTYDIFAAYWPKATDGPDAAIAERLNAMPKYVASRSAPSLSWEGSTLVNDVAAAVPQLRAKYGQTHVIGSANLFQTLLAERLFDRLNLWVYPLLLGTGKRAFADGTVPASLRVVEPAVSSPNGAVQLRYAPTGETPATGDMTRADRGA
jgi:dihydrofolate reductase